MLDFENFIHMAKKRCYKTAYTGICKICNNFFYDHRISAKYCSRSCFCTTRTGNKNPMWRGGITKDFSGYLVFRRNKKMIRVHRNIMEKYLKRKLYKFETVHHLNGIKTDNRIENLELWSSHQHSGQRLSDLIHFVCKYYKSETIKQLNLFQ